MFFVLVDGFFLEGFYFLGLFGQLVELVLAVGSVFLKGWPQIVRYLSCYSVLFFGDVFDLLLVLKFHGLDVLDIRGILRGMLSQRIVCLL